MEEDGGEMSDVPKTFNQKEAQKLLEDHGWTKKKGGKHNVKMEKEGMRPITTSQAPRRAVQ